MSDTTDTMPATEGATTRRKSPGLSGMVLAELQTVASGLGITGTTRMRKGELIEAIRAEAGAVRPSPRAPPPTATRAAERRPESRRPPPRAEPADQADGSEANGDTAARRGRKTKTQHEQGRLQPRASGEGPASPSSPRTAATAATAATATATRAAAAVGVVGVVATVTATATAASRDRFAEGEPQVSPDDVLVPVAGIVDVLDSYAFVRTSGYLPGSNDVYISLSQVRRYGLRRGDAVTGAVRQPKEGERREKFNALVRLDTINGAEADKAKERPDFNKLTPLYPQDRLRLETEPGC